MSLEAKTSSWPLPFGLFFGCAMVASLFTINSIEWMAAAVVGITGLREILKVNSFPIQLAFVFPYLEIVTSLLDAEFNGAVLSPYFYGFGSEVYFMSLAGLVAVYLGWKRQARSWSFGSIHNTEERLKSLSISRLILLYFAFLGVQIIADFLIPYGSSLKQLEKHVGLLSGLIFILILWRYKVKSDQRFLFAAFIIFSFVTSLFSFFSGWKVLFINAGFVFLVQKAIPSGKVLKNLGLTFGIGLIFVLTWQGVKSEYRNFLNGGTRQQKVIVSQSEGLAKFQELAFEFWFEQGGTEEAEREWFEVASTDDALQSTLERVGYLDLFSRMRQFVPSEMPHENGALLRGNLSFALIPRILNPNKGVKDDQWKVEKYTKRIIADNASFSLGHYAEHYIDFGKFGMLFSLFAFGWVGGWITRKVMQGSGVELAVAAGFCFYWMQYFVSFQFDAIKIYGQVFWAVVTYHLLFRKVLLAGLAWASDQP